jgi:hypothetical protein
MPEGGDGGDGDDGDDPPPPPLLLQLASRIANAKR